MKLKKGDKIQITVGKDKGRDGTVDRVYEKQDKILVQGVNLYKRHIKKNQEMPDGGIVDMPRALKASNVMLICPKCKKPTRVGYKLEKNKKVRYCRKCNKTI